MSDIICGVAPSRPRAVRVDDELWVAAQEAARQRGTTVSAVVVAALQDLVGAGPESASDIADRVRADVSRLEHMASRDTSEHN